jgi:hypothetical protein
MTIHIKFPPDVDDFLHEICVNAIIRAINNGTYKGETYVLNEDASENEEEGDQ